jgi:hypothetical protein
MALFDDEGELQQQNQENLEETSELFNESEGGQEDTGEEVEEAEGQEEQQEGQNDETLYAGQYKTFGGMAQAYIRQRRQLGLPEDLQNYATPEALEKAFLRDKGRMDARGKGREVETEEETTDEDLDELDDAQLMSEFARQQMAITQSLGQQPGMMPGQVPNQQMPPQQPAQVPQMQQSQVTQGFQGYNPQQQVPQTRQHSVFDNPGVTADQFAERLMNDPVTVLREVIREEMDIQGSQLGNALYGILNPVVQNQMQLRSAAERDREMRKLEKTLNKRGESLDDYQAEMDAVLQQYPGLANAKDGFAQALGMARLQKAMNSRRKPTGTGKKGGLRPGGARGAGIPKGQYGQPRRLTAEEAERRAIFGDVNKKRGMFDD